MTKVLRFGFFEGGKVGAEDPVGWSGKDVPENEIREGNDLAEALDETREFVSGLDMGLLCLGGSKSWPGCNME